MLQESLGFIGGGVMASALINGILRAGIACRTKICVSDPNLACLEKLKALGIQTFDNNHDVLKFSDVVVLAVKPNIVDPLLRDLALTEEPDFFENKSFISIAAGIPISTIEACLSPSTRSVIRAMPNTPCIVGECAAAYALGTRSRNEDKVVCETIFRAVGTVSEIPEKLMDAVTGLSGSGPAYVFMFMEALADGGVRMGLPRDVAMQLAAQTVKGAAAMCLEMKTHPGVLKDQVCSPGGTTIAGVEALEEHGFRAAAMSAVVAATRRGEELRNTK